MATHYQINEQALVADPESPSVIPLSNNVLVATANVEGHNLVRTRMEGRLLVYVHGDSTHKPVDGWWQSLQARVGLYVDDTTQTDPNSLGINPYDTPDPFEPWENTCELQLKPYVIDTQANSYTAIMELPEGGAWSKGFRSGTVLGTKIKRQVWLSYVISSFLGPNPGDSSGGVQYRLGAMIFTSTFWEVPP